MDVTNNMSETGEELRTSLRNIFNPQPFLENFEGEIPEELRASLLSEVNAVRNKHLGPPAGSEPAVTDIDQLRERFDLVLNGVSSYFPDGLPEEASQSTTDPNIDKELETLDDVTAKVFENDLEFAEGLRNHPLAGFLNSPAMDERNAMPEGRCASTKGKAKKFEYKPLNQSTDASRLVVLHPGGRNDEIKCDLIPLPLSVLEAPDEKTTNISCYEALSYVWGSPTDPLLIEIDGQDFKIGRNLYSALINLRLEDEDRLLWIDAICINQDDIPERNWQVSRMGLIYRSALQTVAWLGPATWGSDMICTSIQAFQTFEEGNADILPPELRTLNTALFGINDVSSPQSNFDSAFINILWDQLDQLFERPFFSRSWVVQEIVLGRHVTIHCGTLSFPYGTFESAMCHSSILRGSLGINTYTPIKTSLTKFSSFSILRSQIREAETEVPLFHLASRFGRLLATDPRDKIYAFLSLSPKLIQEGIFHDHGFSPDYSKSTLEVYRDFTLFCIKKYNNLDILSRPFRNSDKYPLDLENWAEDWPSWVPDWDRRGIREQDFGGLDSLGKNPFRAFNVAGWWEDVEFTLVDGRTIGFAGVEFDEIIAVVEGDVFVDPGSVGGGEEEWNVWERFAMGVDAYGDTAREKKEAFWRTLVADSDGNGSFAPEEFGAMFRCWRSNTPPPNFSGTETELYESFTTQLFNTTRGRKLFRTKRGYLGIGSWQIEVGDSISILQGGKLPILGRETGAFLDQVIEEEGEEVMAKRIEAYRLVGSGGTYVHGVMDGEGVGIVMEEGEEVGGVFFC